MSNHPLCAFVAVMNDFKPPARIILETTLFCIRIITRHILQTRTTLQHTIGAPEHILGVPEVRRPLVCGPQGGLPAPLWCNVTIGLLLLSGLFSVMQKNPGLINQWDQEASLYTMPSCQLDKKTQQPEMPRSNILVRKPIAGVCRCTSTWAWDA